MTGDYLFNVGSLEDDVYIDAEDFDVANWARFMNHADTDDAGNNLQVLFDCEKSTVWFVARRPIMSNEELRYRCGLDYFSITHTLMLTIFRTCRLPVMARDFFMMKTKVRKQDKTLYLTMQTKTRHMIYGASPNRDVPFTFIFEIDADYEIIEFGELESELGH